MGKLDFNKSLRKRFSQSLVAGNSLKFVIELIKSQNSLRLVFLYTIIFQLNVIKEPFWLSGNLMHGLHVLGVTHFYV